MCSPDCLYRRRALEPLTLMAGDSLRDVGSRVLDVQAYHAVEGAAVALHWTGVSAHSARACNDKINVVGNSYKAGAEEPKPRNASSVVEERPTLRESAVSSVLSSRVGSAGVGLRRPAHAMTESE